MTRLMPALFDRRFGDLVEAGRSRLPSLAPAWTDHNAHDPGIMLMELLAWVAEAQMYSLARTRRDERDAYAALMGLRPGGARPASGLIWPDHDDPSSPASAITRHFIIDHAAAIHTSKSELPSFRPTHRILWIPARIRALTTRPATGPAIDHTGANRRGSPAFQPFGQNAGPNDVLRMELKATGEERFFPMDRPAEARLVIGIRTDAIQTSAADREDPTTPKSTSPMEVMLSTGVDRFPLEIIEDTSEGFMRTGVCVLDLSRAQVESELIVLEFRAARGFDRPPRISRIEPNVIPISQSLAIERELHIARGIPDESFDLEAPGLMFEPDSDPVRVEITDNNGFGEWKSCERLVDCGPRDPVYELDPAAARVTFGNGINGQAPTAEGQILVSYTVSSGAGGNTARNRKWIVHGVGGVFGVNPDPIAGGRDPWGWLDRRREARRLAKGEHALVEAADIESAALSLPKLEVGRAWVVPPKARVAETGTVTLVAMRTRPNGKESANDLETPRWLEAIRRQLTPRMLLGTRLVVVGPRYADFTVQSRIEAEPGRDPARVKQAVLDELNERLTLVASNPTKPQRPFGLPATHRDLMAWIQSLPEVRRVPELRILRGGGKAVDEVKVARHGLPRIDLENSTIEIVRSAGASR